MTVLCDEIEESYAKLKSYISASPITLSVFNELKSVFILHINSKRRYMAISNLKDLIDILEKRLSISSVDTTCLVQICTALDDERLFAMYQKHQQLLMKLRQRTVVAASSSPLINIRDLLVNDDLSLDLPSEAINIISNNIGRSWVDLARRLKIKEGDIDTIEERTDLSIPDKARYVLSLYKRYVKPENHPQTLLEALTKIRRNDLKEEVTSVLNSSSAPYL